ncbi:unnamed protein product [Echinostoma caproni]|uniref:Family with sequence similarity 122C n=1 Tax=Echinostoma caproni TaxID=27848 RepID=A0A183BF13_9TREM|nr:unnamed protein product [Echinostoma caproni]
MRPVAEELTISQGVKPTGAASVDRRKSRLSKDRSLSMMMMSPPEENEMQNVSAAPAPFELLSSLPGENYHRSNTMISDTLQGLNITPMFEITDGLTTDFGDSLGQRSACSTKPEPMWTGSSGENVRQCTTNSMDEELERTGAFKEKCCRRRRHKKNRSWNGTTHHLNSLASIAERVMTHHVTQMKIETQCTNVDLDHFNE